MDAIITAFAGLISKISDPVVIVLLLLLAGVVWMLITEQRENRRDRNEVLVPALKEIADVLKSVERGMTQELGDIKNAISAITGKAL